MGFWDFLTGKKASSNDLSQPYTGRHDDVRPPRATYRSPDWLTRAMQTATIHYDPRAELAVDAVSLSKAGHYSLSKSVQLVGDSLGKRKLKGLRIKKIYLIVDHSGSMSYNYENDKVAKLVERILAFALSVSVTQEVEVIPFDTDVHPSIKVGVDNYRTVVKDRIWKRSRMGETNFAGVLSAVHDKIKDSDELSMIFIVTDGDPQVSSMTPRQAREAATAQICRLGSYPTFIKICSFGEVEYLDYLDNMEQTDPGRRLMDNVNVKTYDDPSAASDEQFADDMVDELDEVIDRGIHFGTLRLVA